MSLKGNALVAQSGGPTVVINASMVGVVEAARECADIDTVLGAVHGMDGILNENLIDLFREDPETLQGIRYTPSAALGTSRVKPKEKDLARALEVFKAHDIRYFFYIGGNDSQLSCHLVSQLALQSDWDMRVIGVPKTIDNDLPITDNCPGFASAARLAGSAVQFVSRDAEAFGEAEVIEIMGRHAGWVTGATQVGRLEDRDAPHLVYLPEVKVNPDQFIEDCQEAYGKYGYLVVAVSEGFSFAESEKVTTSDQLDEFGHARLSGVAEALAKMVEKAIGKRCRHDRLGNLHRCFSYAASAVDLAEAYAVGQNAVQRACAGETDVMVTIKRLSDEPFTFECDCTSLLSVADVERVVPAEWINERGNGVTEEFLNYARPLMQGTGECMPQGLPHYPRLMQHFVDKKLSPYVR
ncbi:MAG TPA: 6-phosphofructokinase [Armatimonadota bacterium]|jgi:6-phosphofructokinase 1